MGSDLTGMLAAGDIVLVSESGLKHSLNRTLGRSRWHHVMLYLGNGKVLEVTPKKGCHVSSLDFGKSSYKAYAALRHMHSPAAQRRRIAADALRMFHGRGFSWHQLSRAFLRGFFDWHGVLGRKLAYGRKCKTDRLICSNLIAILYYMSGHLITEKYLPEYVIPRDYDRAKNFRFVFERVVKKR